MKSSSAIFSLIAFILSWITNHSFWWALLHGFLGMFYVIYWVVFYSGW